MGKIVILDEITANKIAAGEVVERPASVIKELVENSIDAGATSVHVEIKNGGISFIKVSDNGSGIDEDDVELAFERHATSKIRKAEDLECIGTMGFRGEALASIASVATVELTTRPSKAEHGVFIKVSGGKFIEAKQVGCPAGTTFVIKDLFFNTPARYKFLKKDTTEATYVADVMERIALANPSVSFKLTTNGNAIMHSPGNNDLKSVIYSIYGRDISQKIKEIKYKDEKIIINGFAGKPEISRGNRNQQTVFVNGRYIRSRVVTSAIDEAYKTMLMKGKFAFAVINIEVNPVLVDVNVHPTKMEVRFSDDSAVFRGVFHGIQASLLGGSREIASAFMEDNSKQGFKVEHIEKKEFIQQPIESRNRSVNSIASMDQGLTYKNKQSQIMEDVSKEAKMMYELFKPLKDNSGEKDVVDASKLQQVTLPVESALISKLIRETSQKEDVDLVALLPDGSSKTSLKMELDSVGNDKNIDLKAYPMLSDAIIIGQIFSTYIILQKENELYLVDQHAAHERIIYEKMKRDLERKQNHPQMLIMPEVIELTPHEFKVCMNYKTFFYDLGFILEEFGNNSIIVRSIPDILTDTQFRQGFKDVLDTFSAKEDKEMSLIADEAIHLMACKAAIKANKRLNNQEIIELLLKMEELFNPFTCPHGRPTVLKLTKYEIEKMFKRAGVN